ncbi:MAG: anti-sigma factor domain-containing protein [Mycetocola sp.]
MSENTGTPMNNDGTSAASGVTDNAEAYVLNALTPDEVTEFEAALAESAELRARTDSAAVVAAALAGDVAEVAPSAALRGTLLAQIAQTPQLPAPQAQDNPDRERTDEYSTPAGSRTDEHSTPAGSRTEEHSTRTGSRAEDRARSRWFRGPRAALMGAAAAVLLFAGGVTAGSVIGGQTQSSVQASAQAVAEISAAADAQRSSSTTATGEPVTMIWSAELGRSAVLIDGLPALASDQTYEAWYIGADGPVKAGLFEGDATAGVWHVLDGRMAAGDAVGITVEPAGGSAAPTTDPIVVFES